MIFRANATLIALMIVVSYNFLKGDVARYRVQISIIVNMIAMVLAFK